ncbi:MAG TPA: LCP family protein [Acidimicrobiia bacterium]|nr:LCP family protein [Acidimicrobiia bacterium]
MSGHPSPPSAPRRLPRWLKISALAALVVVVVVVGGVWWAVKSAESAFRQSATVNADVVDELEVVLPDEPVYFLILGSDSREGVDVEEFGDSAGARSDVVMIARLDPHLDDVTLLSIPRDTWVPIPGHGEDQVNVAFDVGGPQLMIETVRDVFGLPINHYVEIGFVGFQDLVDQLGGVEMTFDRAARDLRTHLEVGAGTVLMDGSQALAFARSRQYQEFVDGEWVGVPATEFGRTKRQQQLVKAILARLRRPSTLTEADSIVASFAQHMSVDATLADSSLMSLAFAFRGVAGSDIGAATLPTRAVKMDGVRVRMPDEPAADETLDAFRSGRPMDEPAPTASLSR